MLVLFGLAAHAGVSRHALIVASNDGGAGLPQLRYAHADAERIHDVLAELGGFQQGNLTVLTEPSRDELLAALREHAWLSEQAPEDMFVFYYSGHANAHGLRLGDEVLPYIELRQSISEMDASVRLGVLDACRSGEITRLKGLSLSEPFATDDTLAAEGEAWLTASSANEDAQESDHIQGSFFTHYLVSGLRGAADKDDGVVSLLEAYQYTHDQTVWRTGRTDAGPQHPTYKFDLHGAGDLPLTDTRDSSALVTIPAHQSGSFAIFTMPDARPIVEVTRSASDDAPTLVALPPGEYLVRKTSQVGVEEATFGLGQDGRFTMPDRFTPMQVVASTRKGEQDTVVSRAFQLGGLSASLREELSSTRKHIEDVLRSRWQAPQPTAVIATPSLPLVSGRCQLAGPDCLSDDQRRSDGMASLRFDSGTLAAVGEIRSGVAHGHWSFYEQGGQLYAQGSYIDGLALGEWTWWYASGQVRLRGDMNNGHRSGRWTEHYDDAANSKRSQIVYANGAQSGRLIEWYPGGQRRSTGQMLNGNRYKQWVFYYPDGSRQSRGLYDASGQRTGRWMTWSETGGLLSKGTYWQDMKHGEWTFWWETGAHAERGSYTRGKKVGRWETFHPSGVRKSRGSYENNLMHGRWTEWHENGQLKARKWFITGEPSRKWLLVSPDGLREIVDHGRSGSRIQDIVQVGSR